MDKEYHQKWFHVKVCIPMIPIFAIVGVLSDFNYDLDLVTIYKKWME